MKKSLREEIAELLRSFQNEFRGSVLHKSLEGEFSFLDDPSVGALSKFNLRIPMIHSKYLTFLIYLDEKISEEDRLYARALISRSILLRHGATNRIDQAKLDSILENFTDIAVDVSQLKANKNEIEELLKLYDPVLLTLEESINSKKNRKTMIMNMLDQLNGYHWKISNHLQAKKFEAGIGG